ncbi:MAG: NADP(H)-dependent aldo-keto reductase [Euryarchaeota archaeon]|nr:NADP(H)-dependent aldo-keto reductase [Euryarchaeota archaeon]
MKYKNLGNTELRVSQICLGTMTFGEQNTEKQAHDQLSFSIDHGINFIDTAEMYAIPPKKETQGLTEKYIGTWIEKNKKRDTYVIATKVAGPGMEYLRGGSRLSKNHVKKAIDDSLVRLKTDYIDLYQTHWPERQTNFFGRLGYTYSDELGVAIDETLMALDDAVQAGKIRYIGVSNETPWGVQEYLNVAKLKMLSRIQSIQNPYGLLNRIFEVGLAEISHRENIGLLAYSPLGFGMLTGKYLKKIPKESRMGLYGDWFTRYNNEKSITATKRYQEIAIKNKLSLTQLALAFVNTRPFLTSNIIGATNLDQLKENIESIDVELSEEIIAELNEVHDDIPNPAP